MKFSTNVLWISVFAILVAVTKVQTCTERDPNATYECIDDSCDPSVVEYDVTKTCKDGYQLTEGFMANLTCRGGSWNSSEEMCTECDPDAMSYGKGCFSTAHCSNRCQYDNVVGCKQDSSSWVECHLENITIGSDILENIHGTIGRESFVSITISTNIPDDEVNVTVTFDNTTTILNSSTVDNNAAPQYTYQIDVRRSSAGVYTFTAQTDFGLDIKTFYVTIYDPVEIIGIYEKESDLPIPEHGNIEITAESTSVSYTCKADGILTPQTYWSYGSSKITTSEMQSRIYQIQNDSTSSTLYIRPGTGIQMKDTGRYTCYSENSGGDSDSFQDVQTINLVVREPGYKATLYAKRQDFLTAVCLLGVFLFATIVMLILFALWTKKQQANFQRNPNRANSSNGRGTNKYEPQHVPSSRRPEEERGEFANIQRPSSPVTTSQTTTPAVQRDTRPQTTNRQRDTRHTKKLPLPREKREIPNMPGMQTHRPGDYQAPRGGGAHHNPAFQSQSNVYSETLYEDGVYDEPATTGQPTYEEPLNPRETLVYDETIP